MRHIRPYQIFTLLDSSPAARVVSVKIPERRDILTLETLLLLAIAKIINARRAFEFGTFYGSTTLNLALTIPKVYTLDLPRDESDAVLSQADAPIMRDHFERTKMDFEGSSAEARITRLYGNSREFNFSRWKEWIDLVFIDGGHDIETVKADTAAALRMVTENGCIAWHDYANPDYPELTAFLGSMDVFHVEETSLCLRFTDARLNERIGASNV